MIGVNGVGKTTSVGKLAGKLKDQGKKVILAAADTFRAAAGEQLTEWANRAGVEIIGGQAGADPASVIYDAVAAAKARNADVLLCDTAGRLHNKKNLMEELRKIYRILEREYPDAYLETLVVLDGTTGQNALAQARQFAEVANVSGIILTKLDGTAKGGIAVAIQSELGIPVKYIGIGEKIDDLQKFKIDKVWIEGNLVADKGNYLADTKHIGIQKVAGSVKVKDFSIDKLKMHLESDKATVIGILPDSVVTKKKVIKINRGEDGDFKFDKNIDVAKVAVVERHQMTGNVATALIEGYGIKTGAIAVTVAHDSHNIIVVGTNNEDMAFAVSKLIELEGGIVVVDGGEVLESMPLPIAGLMSDKSGEWVRDKLTQIHLSLIHI